MALLRFCLEEVRQIVLDRNGCCFHEIDHICRSTDSGVGKLIVGNDVPVILNLSNIDFNDSNELKKICKKNSDL